MYVIGETKAELGGSEYFFMLGAHGNRVPKVDAVSASKRYHALADAIKKDLPHSIVSPALGGLAAAVAKSALGGRLGFDLDLDLLPVEGDLSLLERLFSETNSRFVLTCAPGDAPALEKILQGIPFAKVGVTTEKQEIAIRFRKDSFRVSLADLEKSYKSTLNGI